MGSVNAVSGKKHQEFVKAMINEDFKKAKTLSKNCYKATRSEYLVAEQMVKGLEQYKKDAIWNYYHANLEACQNSIPKVIEEEPKTSSSSVEATEV